MSGGGAGRGRSDALHEVARSAAPPASVHQVGSLPPHLPAARLLCAAMWGRRSSGRGGTCWAAGMMHPPQGVTGPVEKLLEACADHSTSYHKAMLK